MSCLLLLMLSGGIGCGKDDQARRDTIVPVGRTMTTTTASTTGSGTAITTTRGTSTTGSGGTSTTATTGMTTMRTTTPAPLAPVVITELVLYRDPAYLWFEIYNTTDEEIDLTGWTMSDTCSQPRRGVFAPDTKAPPKTYVQIFLDQKLPILPGNMQTELCIFDPDETKLNEANWLPDEVTFGRSYGRWPDLDSPFYVMDTPTPGAPNAIPLSQACGNGTLEPKEPCDGKLRGKVKSCADLFYDSGEIGCTDACRLDERQCVKVPSDVVINEVTSSGLDAIELFNKGSEPVAVGGYRIGNEFYPTYSTYAYVVDPGSMLGPGEYLVAKRLDMEAPGLRITLQDEVTLYNGAGELLDRVVLPKNKGQISYCRLPNATGEFKTCTKQTFGGSND